MEETIATLSEEEVRAIAKRERKLKKRIADEAARLRGIRSAKARLVARSWSMHGWREVKEAKELESMPTEFVK